MVSKIVWPQSIEKTNPFGGSEGFRPLRITFHSVLPSDFSSDHVRALEILLGLATLDQIDSMSFDGNIVPRIFIEEKESSTGYTNLRIFNKDGDALSFHLGVHKSWIDKNAVCRLLGSLGPDEEEKYLSVRKELLEARAHRALDRDIFITSSQLLLGKRDKLEELNIHTPLEALKIVSLYLRVRDEYKYEWVSEIKENTVYLTSRHDFFFFLARGLLPDNWKYISMLDRAIRTRREGGGGA